LLPAIDSDLGALSRERAWNDVMRIESRKKLFCLLVQAFALSSAGVASAQRGELVTSLQDTVRAAFTESATFRAFDVRTREAQGEALRVLGPFDVVANTTVQTQRTMWSAPYGGLSSTGYDDLSLLVGLSTITRENVSAGVTASMPLSSSIDPTISPDQPLVSAQLNVPLLKFGRSASHGAVAHAASLHASAAEALQQDDESQLVARAAGDYWRWVGSREQVALARELEGLTKDQLRDVDQLIAQHARAEADRLPFVAVAENATANWLQAEETMAERQEALWLTLGIKSAPGMVTPAGSLPEVPLDVGEASAIAATARERALGRPLFAYVDREATAAAVRFDGARIGQRPDLSLVVQGTATRVGVYGDATSATPTQMEVGYYGNASLVFSMPVQNRTARGALEVARQQRVDRELDALRERNQVTSTLDTLARDLVTLVATYHQRTRATDAYRAAYDAARMRYRLGSTTALDIVVAEQQLMGSSLAVLADRTAYAVALTQMLHESGLLIALVHGRDVAGTAQRLATWAPGRGN
jgi:outer membrane protein TolC